MADDEIMGWVRMGAAFAGALLLAFAGFQMLGVLDTFEHAMGFACFGFAAVAVWLGLQD